jgi:oligopeptide/dipeptide ABC transporter ATP-binding protein
VSDVVLSVRNLRTQFSGADGTFPAVRDVSFNLHRLERLGIVGESGAGKSALALSILGLIEPPGCVVGGEVLLKGRDLRALPERELDRVRGKEISLVFQDPTMALDPIKSVGDQIVEAIRRHQPVSRPRARALAVELLRDAEVPYAERRLNDYPHHYSGGMRQRVLIAMALANQPEVLIADEPTTALDVTTQAQVLDLLARLAAERGAAIMLITHNLGVVAEFCSTVQVMYAGRIVERGAIEDVLARPTHPYTEALLASVPHPGGRGRARLPAIPGFPPSLAELPPGCSFEPRCPLGHGREVCVADAPPALELDGAAGPVIAECHFAAERLGAKAGPAAPADRERR